MKGCFSNDVWTLFPDSSKKSRALWSWWHVLLWFWRNLVGPGTCHRPPGTLRGAKPSMRTAVLSVKRVLESGFYLKRDGMSIDFFFFTKKAVPKARHLNTPVVVVSSELNPWSKTGRLETVWNRDETNVFLKLVYILDYFDVIFCKCSGKVVWPW